MTALLEANLRDAGEGKLMPGLTWWSTGIECVSHVSHRAPRGTPFRGRLQTDTGKIDKIVLQISRYQHVSNVCGGAWFHTWQPGEAVIQARAAHFYSSIPVTKEVCVRVRVCVCGGVVGVGRERHSFLKSVNMIFWFPEMQKCNFPIQRRIC